MSLVVLTLDSMTRSRRYTDEQLATAVAMSPNMHRLLIALGLSDRGGNYETVWRQIRVLGLDASHLRARSKLAMCSEQEVLEAVRAPRSLAQVLAKLGIRQSGGTQATLKRRLQSMGANTSHLLGAGWRRGSRFPVTPPRPIEEFLVDGRLVKTHALKNRLVRAGLKEGRCEICGRDTWNDGPIPLELDHINGRRDDNRLTNIRLLCPNCHAQTPTYRGRNIGTHERLS